jgi:hypothetical protein
MPAMNTTYEGGGIQTMTEGPTGGPINMQSPTVTADPNMDFYRRMAERMMAQKAQQQAAAMAAAKSQQRFENSLQSRAFENQERAQQQAQNDARRVVPPPSRRKKAIYVKSIGGPNVVGGYIRAQAGDPGAVFAGEVDREDDTYGTQGFANQGSIASGPPDLGDTTDIGGLGAANRRAGMQGPSLAQSNLLRASMLYPPRKPGG